MKKYRAKDGKEYLYRYELERDRMKYLDKMKIAWR